MTPRLLVSGRLAFTNEYQKRKLRNVATGEVIHDPRLGAPPAPQRKGPRIADGVTVGMDTDTRSAYDL